MFEFQFTTKNPTTVKLEWYQRLNNLKFKKIIIFCHSKHADQQFFKDIHDYVPNAIFVDTQYYIKNNLSEEVTKIGWSVQNLARYFNIQNSPASFTNRDYYARHRALGDAILEFQIIWELLRKIGKTFDDVLEFIGYPNRIDSGKMRYTQSRRQPRTQSRRDRGLGSQDGLIECPTCTGKFKNITLHSCKNGEKIINKM